MSINNTHSNKTKKLPAEKKISEKHLRIVNEYFANGMKKSAAVMSVLPEIKLQASAGALFNSMAKKPEVKKYMEQKNFELMESLSISPEVIVSELINHAFQDPGAFTGIKCPEDINKLTPEQRRQIKHWDFTEQTVTDPKGKTTTTKKISLRFKDSQLPLNDLAKYVGLFAKDNSQKRNKIDLNGIPTEALLLILKAMKATKTIEI